LAQVSSPEEAPDQPSLGCKHRMSISSASGFLRERFPCKLVMRGESSPGVILVFGVVFVCVCSAMCAISLRDTDGVFSKIKLCMYRTARVIHCAIMSWWESACVRQQYRRRILLLGLENSGKSAFTRLLAGRRGVPRLEHHVLHYESGLDGVVFELIDPSSVCGGCRVRRLDLWDNLLCSQPDAIMFIVDASDVDRFPEAQESLQWILEHRAAAGLPVVVLGNKVDVRGAVGSWELKCGLGLAGLTCEQRRALLGCAGDNGLPFELRHRIASFHPHEARAPPQRSQLEVRMCSIEKDWAAHSAVRWLLQEVVQSARRRATRMLCRVGGQSVQWSGCSSLRNFLGCSGMARREAPLLP